MRTLDRLAPAFPIDFSHRREYRPYVQAPRLGAYYVRWDAGGGAYGEGWNAERFDANGVLLSGKDHVYHPIRIAQYALEQYARLGEPDGNGAREAFLAQSLWLRRSQETRRGVKGCYPFPFAWARYGAPMGFLSAMAQGEAISVLLRAAELTSSGEFFEAALRAAEPFRRELRDGGVCHRSREGDLIFEEAAGEPPSHILNGWIFAAWGLFELGAYVPWARERFRESMQTLEGRLPLYDSGRWSYYSLQLEPHGFRRLATLKYHAFHIAQLHVLASMTKNPVFEETAQRWERYTQQLESRVALWANSSLAALHELRVSA